MGLPLQTLRFYTPDEYLELEREAEVRHEYIDGEIFEMAGARRPHSRICTNLVHDLDNQFRGRECNVYPNDMRVKVNSEERYFYPDVVAICGEELYEDEREDNLLNPTVIFEILSKSTEAFDRGLKFEAYQSIPSLREFILISPEPYRVEQFVRRDANEWTYFEFRKPEDVVTMGSIGCQLSLSDIYYKIPLKFPRKVEV